MEISTNDLEQLITKCLEANQKVSEGTLDELAAVRVAALALNAQLKLAQYIEQLEIKAKNLKNKLELISAEKYFHFKSTIEGKATEVALSNYVSTDEEIVALKNDLTNAEAEYRKAATISNTIKDLHVFFRTLSKMTGWSDI